MENPNVWKLMPHPVSVKYYETKMDCPELRETIRHHHFNHSVCCVFLDTLAVPQDIREVLTVDSAYYKVIDLPIYRFIEKNFVEAFVQCGNVLCLSVNRQLDTENVFAVAPDGHLVLSITTDEFLSLGIEKSPAVSIFKQKSDNKYHVRINLKESCFVPGKNNYERVLSRLLKASHLRATFICCWEPPDETTCPSSLALYLDKVCGVEVVECNLQFDYRVDYNVRAPLPSTPHAELFEWLAFQSIGFTYDCSKTELKYLTSYAGLEEKVKRTGPCCVLTWTGLITSSQILALFDRIKKYVETKKLTTPIIPMVGLQIVGFDDAPVSWRSDAHHRLTNGDNNLALAIFGSGKIVHAINVVAPH